MERYSLLQETLGQTIGRAELEEASRTVPSVARADCAGIAASLFGIVVSGLAHQEALAFQTALRRHGFPTRVVRDMEIPSLHEAYTVQRISPEPAALVLTDTMGRAQSRPLDQLVFVAGGFISRLRPKPVTRLERAESPSWSLTREVRTTRLEEAQEFRMDFFFSTAPHRLRASVGAESVVFFRDRPLRLENTALLLGAMMDLRELLPPERVGEGLKAPGTQPFYPSLGCYEEEIRWRFHRLKTGA